MTTKFIGIREFRQNLSHYVQRAQKTGERFIVMKRNKPLFELKPFSPDEDVNTLFAKIMQAKQEVERGEVYSHEEVLSLLS